MRMRVGVSLGVLALAGACATTSTTTQTSALEIINPSMRPETPTATVRETLDSLYAQSIADQEGPRVSIRAQVNQLASTRRVRAAFNVEDDAYVLIGHVDAAGVVRIVFPADPHDDGFVQGGGRSYQTAEFFAGFADQYAFRHANFGRFYGPQPQAYDGGGGYLFIVASWRPMHFEKFSSDDVWDSFEVTSEAYVRDPRPAIYEFASVLVAENREAYTVKFATYFNSQDFSMPGSYTGFSSFGLGMCSASFYGWGRPISWSYLTGIAPFVTPGFGGDQLFYYRGRRYAYDSLQGCAVPLPYPSYQGIAVIPTRPGIPGRGTTPATGRTRALSAFDSPRDPLDPQPVGGRLTPDGGRNIGTASNGNAPRISSEYRRRGLITEDRPETPLPSSRAPRIDEGARTRPSISQMTERRAQNGNEGNGSTRSRLGADDSRRVPVDRSQAIDRGRARTNNNNDSRYSPRDNGGDQGARQTPSRTEPRSEPRSQAPRSEPRSEPRSSAPRSEPRSEPRSTPPVRTAEPRSSEPRSTSRPRTTTPPDGSKPTP